MNINIILLKADNLFSPMIELHFSLSRILIKDVKVSLFDNQNIRISLFLKMLAKEERNRFPLNIIFKATNLLMKKRYSFYMVHYEFQLWKSINSADPQFIWGDNYVIECLELSLGRNNRKLFWKKWYCIRHLIN